MQSATATIPERHFAGTPSHFVEQKHSGTNEEDLRAQLGYLRRKRKEMVNQIPHIASELMDALKEETPEARKKRVESCIDRIEQLGD